MISSFTSSARSSTRARFNRQTSDRSTYAGKRLLDVFLTLLAIPLVLPLILLLAVLVGRDGANPFFVQRRLGRDGRVFRMLKLRTMVPDAEARLATLLDTDRAARIEWERFQKLSSDPRVTPFGQFLRKTSLDELPQFLNVLLGTMSLVGPRPMLPEQRDMYPGTAYYRLKPGITGPWQVSERNGVSFSERATFDAIYLRDQSVLADISLILRTAGAVVRMSGR